MKTMLAAVAIGLISVSPCGPAIAQTSETGNIEADWYNVIFLKFKPSGRARAEEIQETYYAPAGEAAGMPQSIMLHMTTGDWDMIRIGPMVHGPASLAWANSEEARRWRAEFVRIAGGEERAEAIDVEFASLIEARRRDIAHVDTD